MGLLCFSLSDGGSYWCEYMARTRAGAAVEIRLDCFNFEEEDITHIFSQPRQAKLIATYHIDLPSQLDNAAQQLSTAILAGADYVDIPLDFPENSRRWLMNLAMNRGCRTIVSWHDYSDTDSREKLLEMARKAQYEGADIIKIVTTAHSREDAEAVLSLYEHFKADQLIAFAMGQEGSCSRWESFNKGAPLFYLSPSRGSATASGQPYWAELLPEDAVQLRGTVSLPASKSFAQRAIVLAAMTSGTTKLYGVTLCDDVAAAIGVARSLYADVHLDSGTLTIEGHQNILKDGLKVRDNMLFAGESGLLARLCIPLAGLAGKDVVVAGEGSLLKRRIDDHRQALRKLGLKPSFSGKGYLPVVVSGRLHSGHVEVPGDKGSQMVSGLLLALSQCRGGSTVSVENITSSQYISLTTYIASFFGLDGYICRGLEHTIDFDEEDDLCRTWYIDGMQKVTPVIGLEVERDWSAAAMLIVAGALMGDLTLTDLDMDSFQPDLAIFDLLKYNQVDIQLAEDNRTVNVRRSIIQPFNYDISDSPDLFAPLFLLACCAGGKSVILGIERLRNKESDRASSFAQEFRKLGVQTSISDDIMIIYGRENRRFDAAHCSAHGDHRLAMALHLASLMCDGTIEVEDPACVAKSFPEFYELIDKLKRK